MVLVNNKKVKEQDLIYGRDRSKKDAVVEG